VTVAIVNPYASGAGLWRRGNLHAHTTNSDGDRTPQDVVDAYAALGYDFLMLSDHDFVTDPVTLQDRGMALIPGNEVTARGPHILHVNASTRIEPSADRCRVLDAITADGDFAVVSHPNWEEHFAHCPQGLLEEWNGYAGIEIYNGVVRRLTGNPQATDRWDRLLGLGRRVGGFASDDSHCAGDDGIAWVMAQSPSNDPRSILDSLRRGAFYASTGVSITSIRSAGLTIEVRTENAQRIVVHSDFGHRVTASDGPSMEFTLPGEEGLRYVRFECWGPGEAQAWTQPFFLERI